MSETSLTPMNVKATTKRAQTEADSYTIQPTSRALLVREHPPDQICCVGMECSQTIHPSLVGGLPRPPRAACSRQSRCGAYRYNRRSDYLIVASARAMAATS